MVKKKINLDNIIHELGDNILYIIGIKLQKVKIG